ncbi:heavy metal transport/detoxification protein [Arcobacter nitrofigilis DSM 7299]|uniref:Heavy metal transport/detoxification protein n=1 Tax=Arcobacter nitrofigilis (strain ATCC 33309 / DSM 7299 / CCUG 15893 / LMG 7604 / NCTC 12251 / CI) TaxID=572480 RepID=D5V491_ARCNC|nr:heavy metal transport/detoxification protein [Arcobacter nitrofigilis]ADG91824.1 heavy metal transport/detoxification protein [Arcobacter nitrofigilis DSM 7299]
MKRTYKSEKINCAKCENLIKVSLEDDFGPIDVDLTKTPKEVTVEITSDEQENNFKEEMKDLGFDILD